MDDDFFGENSGEPLADRISSGGGFGSFGGFGDVGGSATQSGDIKNKTNFDTGDFNYKSGGSSSVVTYALMAVIAVVALKQLKVF